jgi:hypothetical protein
MSKGKLMITTKSIGSVPIVCLFQSRLIGLEAFQSQSTEKNKSEGLNLKK